MKTIIFGSTGTIGKHLIHQSLERGLQVTAFARNPEKVEIKHPHLTVIKGDVLQPESVKKAVAGHDVVLCALGAGRKGTVRSVGTLNILKAMEEKGVDRLICQTTLGCGESKGNLNFFWKYIMFGWLLKDAFIDHEQQEKHIVNSKVNWTIIRPAAFTDAEKTEKFLHGFGPNENELELKISRADVAYFMLQQLSNQQYLHQKVALSY